MAAEQPFDGEPPQVTVGDSVKVWSVTAAWFPMVAMGPARYDHENAVGGRIQGKVWLTVPVARPDDFARYGQGAPWVNWPAEHVRPVGANQNGEGE
jgi:hypothetical protein